MLTMQAASEAAALEAEARERNYAKLSREDEEFRRKILDLHRKLSDVDEESLRATSMEQQQQQQQQQQPHLQLTPQRLRELEMVVKRAEETFERNAAAEKEAECSGTGGGSSSSTASTKPARKKKVEFEDLKNASESNFLNRLRLRKRSIKLLGFLQSSKSQDSGEASKAQEERAARLLKMYMPDKPTSTSALKPSGANTIAIHHTSRDRRFWKLRNRRRSSST